MVCRLGQVMGLDGGAFPKLMMISKLGMGGAWGSGEQWMSWIHKYDVINAFLFLINNTSITGYMNVTSPEPVRNKTMMHLIRQHLHTKSVIPTVPACILRMTVGEFSSTFLNGQRVIPRNLINAGYTFRYPALDDALSNLIQKY